MRDCNIVSWTAGFNNVPTIRFRYRNWKGDEADREINGVPAYWFGTSPYHDGEQWFLRGCDSEKKEVRDFAVRDIIRFY